MRYIYLAGSIIFGIAGISQAMDAVSQSFFQSLVTTPVVFDFQYLTVSFSPAPLFIRILLLSIGLFCLFLIRRKLRALGLGNLSEYILE